MRRATKGVACVNAGVHYARYSQRKAFSCRSTISGRSVRRTNQPQGLTARHRPTAGSRDPCTQAAVTAHTVMLIGPRPIVQCKQYSRSSHTIGKAEEDSFSPSWPSIAVPTHRGGVSQVRDPLRHRPTKPFFCLLHLQGLHLILPARQSFDAIGPR